MKSKIISTLFFALLFSIFLASAADIALSPTKYTNTNVHPGDTISFQVSVTNLNDTEILNNINLYSGVSDLISGSNKISEGNVTALVPVSIGAGESETATITINVPQNQVSGNYTGTIKFDGEYPSKNATAKSLDIEITVSSSSNNNSSSSSLPAKIQTKYDSAENRNDYLSLEIDDVNVVEGFGDDEDYWYPLDKLEITVTVENEHNDEKIKDITLYWGLYNQDTGKWYIDDEESDFDLKDGDDKDVVLTFELDEDIEDLEDGDYTFYVWATGEVDDNNDTVVFSLDKLSSLDIRTGDDFVIPYNIQMSNPANCGSTLEITAEVWNIGDSDQDDVTLEVYNKELGIDQTIQIGDIDGFDNKKITFDSIKIPSNATAKVYILKFTVYDEDQDVFENDEDDESYINVPLKIEGTCGISNPTNSNAVISADLNSETSEAIAGKQIIVDATITNTGATATTYLISVYGNSEWAVLGAIDPQEVTIEPGKSQDLSIYLNIKDEAEGEKSFTIKATQKTTGNVSEQEVSIEVIKSGNSISNHIKENWFVYTIIGVNLILVILIILAVRRLSAPRMN